MRKLKNEELDRLEPSEFKKARKLNACIVLDDVRSLNNVGSAFRTADAFLMEKVWLCGITGSPPHREINKTALGATETVDWEYAKNILEVLQKLKAEGWIIVTIEQADKSISLDKFMPYPHRKYAFIFGNEVAGVNEQAMKNSDLVVEIPQFGTKHSLNISVSVGIVVWDFVAKSSFTE